MTATVNRATPGRYSRFPIPVAVLAALVWMGGCTTLAPAAATSCYHENAAVEVEIGYCEALREGRFLHVSGIAGQGPMESAVRSVYERMSRVLPANGYTFADVVKENVYATDLDAFIRNKEIRKEFYKGALPAATWVQVGRLYVPSFVVEIEVTAEKTR
jgi:enamine deaminase RidA (YjgF/YER057c/UK114 family)